MTRLEQIRKRLEAARAEVIALCKGKHWRMTIPVQDDDSDQTLMASLGDLRDLLELAEKVKLAMKYGTYMGTQWWENVEAILSRLDAPEVEE